MNGRIKLILTNTDIPQEFKSILRFYRAPYKHIIVETLHKMYLIHPFVSQHTPGCCVTPLRTMVSRNTPLRVYRNTPFKQRSKIMKRMFCLTVTLNQKECGMLKQNKKKQTTKKNKTRQQLAVISPTSSFFQFKEKKYS